MNAFIYAFADFEKVMSLVICTSEDYGYRFLNRRYITEGSKEREDHAYAIVEAMRREAFHLEQQINACHNGIFMFIQITTNKERADDYKYDCGEPAHRQIEMERPNTSNLSMLTYIDLSREYVNFAISRSEELDKLRVYEDDVDFVSSHIDFGIMRERLRKILNYLLFIETCHKEWDPEL